MPESNAIPLRMDKITNEDLLLLIDQRLADMEILMSHKIENMAVALRSMKKKHGLTEQVTIPEEEVSKEPFPEPNINRWMVARKTNKKGRPAKRTPKVEPIPEADRITKEDAIKLMLEKTGMKASTINVYIASSNIHPELNTIREGVGKFFLSRQGVDKFIMNCRSNKSKAR